MKVITFCYRKIINSQSSKPWEKMVFDDSYVEFRLQVQNYDTFRQYPAYGDLVHHTPSAQRLPHQVAPAVSGYIQQLGNIVPDILNNQGRRFMRFDRFQFEIINSHFDQKNKHQVAIQFFSEKMIWHNTIDDYLLLSAATEDAKNEVLTQLMQIQPYLSIYSLQDETP